MDSNALISWKTDAWKDRNMVAGYAQRMALITGGSLMKNRVETAIFEKYVQGKTVLDVGVGTGRASLPLAKAGYEVTGLDSSVAMLDKCRELAGSVPMNLVEGDVARLPFADASFDTVMSLNTTTHFPHWREIIREWSRVAKPGGRFIFDVYSMDHDIAYAASIGERPEWGVEHFASSDVSAYYLRVGIEDMVRALSEISLKVHRIVPYGVFFGSGGFNRFFKDTALEGRSWDRLLSWVAADPRLFAFFVLLEEELVSHLPTAAVSRYMVVAEKQADEAHNERWLRNHQEYAAALSGGLDAKVLEKYSDFDAGEFRGLIGEVIKHAPARYALARILTATNAWPHWQLTLKDFVGPEYMTELESAVERDAIDTAACKLLEGFHEDPQLAEFMKYRGIPVANGLEYDLMIDVLDKAVGAFDVGLQSMPAKAVKK